MLLTLHGPVGAQEALKRSVALGVGGNVKTKEDGYAFGSLAIWKRLICPGGSGASVRCDAGRQDASWAQSAVDAEHGDGARNRPTRPGGTPGVAGAAQSFVGKRSIN